MADITIVCGDDEELAVSKRYKNTVKIMQPYVTISRHGIIRGKTMGIPLTELYMEFNKEEQWLYKLIWQKLNYLNNQAVIGTSELDRATQNKVSRAYILLKGKDLVRRVRPGTYMINPNAVIYPETQKDNIIIWDSLK